MKTYLFFIIAFTIISCTALKGIDMSNISLGMNKTEVRTKMKFFNTKTIGAKQYSDGNLEVLQISEIYSNDNGIDDYWLYFFNDKLVYSEPINSVKWQTEDWSYKLDEVHYSLNNN